LDGYGPDKIPGLGTALCAKQSLVVETRKSPLAFFQNFYIRWKALWEVGTGKKNLTGSVVEFEQTEGSRQHRPARLARAVGGLVAEPGEAANLPRAVPLSTLRAVLRETSSSHDPSEFYSSYIFKDDELATSTSKSLSG
jgi:hypothetical protein